MSAHTPGPWVWRWKDGSLRQQGFERPYGAPVLLPHYDHDSGIGVDVSDADANLISAAPDLLEVLREVPSLLEYAYGHVSSVTADRVKQSVLPAIRAAIAKATGEAP